MQVLDAIERQYDAGSEASHRVIHQDGDRVTFRECSRQFATKKIGELFALATLERGTATRLMMKLASPSNTNSSSRGHFFEAVMHAIVSNGGSFLYKLVDVPCNVPASAKRGPPTAERRKALQIALDNATVQAQTVGGTAPGTPLRMTVPQLEQQLFEGGSNVTIGDFSKAAKQCTAPCYLRPSNDVHPVIDACIYPDTLLNFKVAAGQVGSLNEELLEAHLQCLPNLPCYYFDYFVPTDVFSTFKSVPLKRDAAKHPRAALTHVRVVKVEAKLQPLVRTVVKMHVVRGASLLARVI
jgi:hypothetical protein